MACTPSRATKRQVISQVANNLFLTVLDSFALLRRVYYELSLYESYAGGHKFKAVAKGAKVDRAPRKIRVPRRFGSVVLTHRVT